MSKEENEEYIRVAAYYLWEKEGRPEGVDFEHWVRAKADAAKAESKCAKKAEPKKAAAPAKKTTEKKAEAKKPALAKKIVKK